MSGDSLLTKVLNGDPDEIRSLAEKLIIGRGRTVVPHSWSARGEGGDAPAPPAIEKVSEVKAIIGRGQISVAPPIERVPGAGGSLPGVKSRSEVLFHPREGWGDEAGNPPVKKLEGRSAGGAAKREDASACTVEEAAGPIGKRFHEESSEQATGESSGLEDPHRISGPDENGSAAAAEADKLRGGKKKKKQKGSNRKKAKMFANSSRKDMFPQ